VRALPIHRAKAKGKEKGRIFFCFLCFFLSLFFFSFSLAEEYSTILKQGEQAFAEKIRGRKGKERNEGFVG